MIITWYGCGQSDYSIRYIERKSSAIPNKEKKEVSKVGRNASKRGHQPRLSMTDDLPKIDAPILLYFAAQYNFAGWLGDANIYVITNETTYLYTHSKWV